LAPCWWLVLYLRRASPQRGRAGGVLAWIANGENVEVGVEGYSKFELSAMGVVPIMGLSFGGDDKKLTDLFLSLTRVGILKMGFASKP
jgi:hypothetical protein